MMNNEQMVSVPRELLERISERLERFNIVHNDFRDHLTKPAAQHLGNSKLVDNIHALLALDARGTLVPSGIGGLARELLESSAAALSAQHQGEPVAYAVFADNGNIRIWSTDCEAVGIKVMQEEGKQAIPLYAHPPTSDGFSAGDMADQGAKAFAARDGEVQELRAALKFYADREHYHFESGNWDTVSGEPLNILWCGDDPDFIEDGTVARNALSASAEPSAPVERGPGICKGANCTSNGKTPHSTECRFEHARAVASGVKSVKFERDERADFERKFVVQEGVFFSGERNEYRSMNGRAVEETDATDLNLRLSGWQARAALERKP